jgi:glycosyltransferase involved in cell wall biosynthesis
MNTVFKKSSICILVYSLRGYGSERVALNLAQGFLDKGLSVDFVIIESGGEFIKMVPPKARCIELGVTDLRSISTWKKIQALAKYLKQERPTALVSIYDTINLAFWAKFLAGVSTKIFVDVQNTLSNEFTGTRGKLKSYLVRLSYPWSNGVITSSKGVAQDLADFAGIHLTNTSIIYNPAVTPEIFEKAKQPVHHPWFASGEPPVILGVGRLAEQKDFRTLIKAFALVRKQHLSRLMILGEGHLRFELETLINELGLQDSVALPGYSENP